MKYKNKGFTLVEVIATMTILGIIMLLAIPNITGVIEKNRAKTYVEDAKKFIALAKYKVAREDNLNCTMANPCKWTLGTLDLSKEIDKGPYGYSYSTDGSWVKYDGQSYSVKLYENMAGTYSGISAGPNDAEKTETVLYNESPIVLINKYNAKEKALGQDMIYDNTYSTYPSTNNNSSYSGY